MTRRQRLAALIALTLAGSGGVAAAAATAAQKPPKVPQAVERVHAYYRTGPSAVYGSDYGGLGGVAPLTWQEPEGVGGSAVVEASFQYRTHGTGPFDVSVAVKRAGGPRPTVRPGELVLAPAPDGGSTTVRFVVPELPGGHTYQAYLGVNSRPTPAGHNKVTTRKVVLTVDATTGR